MPSAQASSIATNPTASSDLHSAMLLQASSKLGHAAQYGVAVLTGNRRWFLLGTDALQVTLTSQKHEEDPSDTRALQEYHNSLVKFKTRWHKDFGINSTNRAKPSSIYCPLPEEHTDDDNAETEELARLVRVFDKEPSTGHVIDHVFHTPLDEFPRSRVRYALDSDASTKGYKKDEVAE